MKAVVLAGGLRSGSEVPGSGLPRALWPFPHEPLIAHVLGFLKRSGCGEIAVCANGKTRMIARELSQPGSRWEGLHYSEDPLPRGPAGCLRDLQEWLGGETFVAIQGTGAYDFDLGAMRADHDRSAAAVTVGARQCPDDHDLLEPAGVYLVNPSTLHLVQAQGYQDIKEQFLPRVLAQGQRVRCHALRGSATLIHSPGHYLSGIREAILQAAATLPPGFRRVSEQVVAHESAKIHESVRITGPAWIEADVRVEERAVLAGPVVLGPGVMVGARALLHRTVAMQQAQVAAGAELFSTILPPGAHAEAKAARSGIPATLSQGGRQLRESCPAHPLGAFKNLLDAARRATSPAQGMVRP